jgi:hypothetical protein
VRLCPTRRFWMNFYVKGIDDKLPQ